MKESIFELWYSIADAGDGSVYPLFFTTEKQAKTHQIQHNINGMGWAEDCYGAVELIIADGVINLVTKNWMSKKTTYKPLSVVKQKMTEITTTRFNELLKTEETLKNLNKLTLNKFTCLKKD